MAKSNLTKILDQQIEENTSARELKFSKVKDSLGKKISKINQGFTSDLGALVNEIFDDAVSASIDELKVKSKRLESIRKYIEASPRAVKEYQKINKSLTEAQEAIASELTLKNRVMQGTASFIANNSVDVTSLLVAMAKDDPIMGFAMKFVGDKFKGWREKRKELKKTTSEQIKKDAISIQESYLTAKEKDKKDYFWNGGKSNSSAENSFIGSGSSELVLKDILSELKDIKSNTTNLVRTSEEDLTRQKSKEFEEIESRSELARSVKILSSSKGYDVTKLFGNNKKNGGGILGTIQSSIGAIPDFLGNLLGSALGTGLITGKFSKLLKIFTSPAKLIGKLLLPFQVVLDSVLGYFSAEKWGASGVAGVIGGLLGGTFDNKILNVFANAGKWGAIGATAGSVIPVFGTLIGGAIGTLLGGVLGYLGGERLAKWSDAIGDKVVKAFTGIWEWFGGIFETISAKLKNIPGMETVSNYFKDMKRFFTPDDQFWRGIDVIKDYSGRAYDATASVVGGAWREAKSNASAKFKKGAQNISDAKNYVDTQINKVDNALLGESAIDKGTQLVRKTEPNVQSDLYGINFKSYAKKIAEKESSNNQLAVNPLNYLGKYQMGADALIDVGLVHKSAKGNNRKLNNPKYWKHGLSKERFLQDSSLQDFAFTEYTKGNFNILKKNGVIQEDTSKEDIAGRLMGAHLVGPGSVKKYISEGKISKDANNMSVAQYIDFGKSSQSSAMGMEISPKIGSATPTPQPKIQTTIKTKELSEKTAGIGKTNNIINDNKIINNVIGSSSSGNSNTQTPKGPSYSSSAGIDFTPATGGAFL